MQQLLPNGASKICKTASSYFKVRDVSIEIVQNLISFHGCIIK